MQYKWLLALTCLGFCVQTSIGDLHGPARIRRQASTSNLPTLPSTSNNPTNSGSTAQSSAAATSTPSSVPSSNSAAAASSSSSSSRASSSSSRTSTSTHVSKTSAAASATSAVSSASSTAEPNINIALPLQPEITPALSIAGAILIVTGTIYTLIGIKNIWLQIFLSTAYLVSISVMVLIDYVMHPPVSDAIQGAYFVGIFMTGCIFGGGALIFKEVTEGLGCLLGGFALGMWFLTLKSGGIISGSTGVGILLAVFCIVGWGLSFSKHTRDYALMGSTSFAGATAFTLGIDCFSRAGYKEFWLYIWNLNSDLFPLNTNTYPITRGIRVEIAVIVLGTLIGIISQLKLWKVIRERRKEKEAIRLEEESRRDAVDEALGRHLERQNEIAKQQWEKVYGEGPKRPNSMVDSVMDSEDQSKRTSRVSVVSRRMHSGLGPATQVVEMRPVNLRSASNLNANRQSSMSVNAIPEENEDQEPQPHNRSTGDLSAKSRNEEVDAVIGIQKISQESALESEPSLTEGPTYANTTADASSVGTLELEPVKKVSKRRSFQGFLKRLSGHYPNAGSGPPSPNFQTMSEEALVLPSQMHHSRASSVAATIDEDHDKPNVSDLKLTTTESTRPPAIVVSPAAHANESKKRGPYLDVPPSPPALSVEFDPEELARPITHGPSLDVRKSENSLRSVSQAQSQTPERRGSSGEQAPIDGPKTNLTTGALEAVPSQLSNVVLSYRTNEWAKHITIADAPVVEEPQGSDSDKEDLPTQVLNIVTGTKEVTSKTEKSKKELERNGSTDSIQMEDRSLAAVTKPPKPHVLPERVDTVNSNKSGTTARSGSLKNAESTEKKSMDEQPRALSKPKPTISTPRGFRSTSTPMLLGQSLVGSPIEENVESTFPPPPKQVSIGPSPSSSPIPPAERQNLLRNQSIQRSMSQQDVLLRSPPGMRSTSQPDLLLNSPPHMRALSPQGFSQNVPPIRSASQLDHYQSYQPYQQSVRSNSQLSYHHNQPVLLRSPSTTSTITQNTDILNAHSFVNNGPIARPDTRLSGYESRQPIRQSTAPTSQQRETMLADWRASMRADLGVADQPEQTMAQRRADMIAQKAMLKRSESQMSYMQASKEGVMDQMMRRGDMQEVHRAALRKMQEKASQNAK